MQILSHRSLAGSIRSFVTPGAPADDQGEEQIITTSKKHGKFNRTALQNL
jgi:hypothetical protein